MPARDGTGPWGAGPMTGRGLGWCAAPRGVGRRTYGGCFGLGRGWWGRGPGRGWGWRRGFWPGDYGPGGGWAVPRSWSREEQLQWLKNYTANLENALEEARRQIEELEKKEA
ncbi:MAG: DUF5320 domain-containing protein [Desulfosoma sp.]